MASDITLTKYNSQTNAFESQNFTGVSKITVPTTDSSTADFIQPNGNLDIHYVTGQTPIYQPFESINVSEYENVTINPGDTVQSIFSLSGLSGNVTGESLSLLTPTYMFNQSCMAYQYVANEYIYLKNMYNYLIPNITLSIPNLGSMPFIYPIGVGKVSVSTNGDSQMVYTVEYNLAAYSGPTYGYMAASVEVAYTKVDSVNHNWTYEVNQNASLYASALSATTPIPCTVTSFDAVCYLGGNYGDAQKVSAISVYTDTTSEESTEFPVKYSSSTVTFSDLTSWRYYWVLFEEGLAVSNNMVVKLTNYSPTHYLVYSHKEGGTWTAYSPVADTDIIHVIPTDGSESDYKYAWQSISS